MALLPWWTHLIEDVKFLHVVRDGRDIAFSHNQSPVRKFYDVVHTTKYDRQIEQSLKSIRLWSDWNSQVYYWSLNKIQNDERYVQGKRRFSYMILHAEDIVSENKAVKFAAMRDVARWIGSSRTYDQICCMALEEVKNLGASGARSRQGKGGVKSRYGKWVAQVASNPTLNKSIHEYGEEGLRIFGYVPMRHEPPYTPRNPNDNSSMVTVLGFKNTSVAGDYNCNLSRTYCNRINGVIDKRPYNKRSNTTLHFGSYQGLFSQGFNDGPKCSFLHGYDLQAPRDGHIKMISLKSRGRFRSKGVSIERCCSACYRSTSCKYFTYDGTVDRCYLKRQISGLIKDKTTVQYISGYIKERANITLP
jgi:hypothetical protein